MTGRIVWTGRRGLAVRLREERLLDLPVLRAEVPGAPGPGRMARGLRALERAGAGSLLQWEWEQAPRRGPRPVVTRGLWQRLAPELALAELRRMGQDPARAVAEVRTGRVTPAFLEVCRRLGGQVRALSLSLARGEEETAWWLEREFGIPVTAGPGDVTLGFTPGPGLPLWMDRPLLPDYTLGLRGVALPEQCPPAPLLALSVELGRVRLDAVQILPAGAKCLDRPGETVYDYK